MTTAPTPQTEALRLAAWLNEGAWHQMRLGDVEAAGRELKRLHAENERLLAQVHKLEMDALDLASENSILKRQEQAELEARKPLPMDRIREIAKQYNFVSVPEQAAFIGGLRIGEQEHGITGDMP